ncbi:MAG: DNA polymerase III subunit gamma/tau, partial [Oscillospiraceae bacterium]|nr:DNA polymerase III subunit gamma/tau [Oscillospiraceae bacterium]
VEELDAASNNGVDNVRALRDEAVYSPAAVRRRVYIVDEVHMLSISAFNALLKILEEPPEHLMFILATTELNKVPATILSRCQRYNFRRLPPETVASRLQYVAREENLELTLGAAEMLGRLAEGAMRDGLNMLDQCMGRGKIDEDVVRDAMGLAGGARTAEILFAVAEGDTARALAAFDALWQDGKSPETLLGELCSLERDALILSVAPKGGNALLSGAYDDAVLRSVCEKFSPGRLASDMERIQETLGNLRNVQNPRTAAELCLIRLCEPAEIGSLRDLAERIARLEQGAPIVRTGKQPVQTPVPESAPQAKPLPQEQPKPERKEQPQMQPEPQVAAQPEPETAKESAPAVEMQKSAPTVAAADSVGLWQNILESVRGELPVGTFNMLSDGAAVGGKLVGDMLTVQYKNGFARMMLDKPNILEAVRAAAERTTGRKLRISSEDMLSVQTDESKKDKLADLAKFGVTFE